MRTKAIIRTDRVQEGNPTQAAVIMEVVRAAVVKGVGTVVVVMAVVMVVDTDTEPIRYCVALLKSCRNWPAESVARLRRLLSSVLG